MRKSTLKGITSVLLAGVLAGGICALGYSSRNGDGKWFKNGDINSWHWSDKTDSVQDNQPQASIQPEEPAPALYWGTAYNEKGVELQRDRTYEMPSSVCFASLYSDEQIERAGLTAPSIEVSATHTIQYLNLKADWSVTYADGTDASDKVSVTPNEDGGFAATVRCEKAFDSVITLTVALRNDPTVKATTQLNYIRRVEGIMDCKIEANDIDCPLDFSFKPQLSAGTQDGKLYADIQWSFTLDFEQRMQAYLMDGVYDGIKELAVYKEPLILKDGYYTIDCADRDEYFSFGYMFESYNDFDAEHKQAYHYAFYQAAQNYTEPMLEVSLDVYVYNDIHEIQHYYPGSSTKVPNSHFSGNVECEASPVLSLNVTNPVF